MSLELSGTTGVKGVAGSVSAPSIVGDDTNTGISFPAADTIKFSTGGVERMEITNSGVSGTGIGGGVVKAAVRRYSGLAQTTGIGNAGFTQIDNAYVDITPTSASNYIKLGGLFTWEGSDAEAVYSFRWKKVISGGSTTSIDSTQASGNRPAITYKELGNGGLASLQLNSIFDLSGTTSSIRYYLEVFCDGANQTLYLNRTHADLNDPRDERGTSYFSAEEINISIFTFTNDS